MPRVLPHLDTVQPPYVNIRVVIAGTPVVIRTMTTADREIEARFVRELSDQSRYFRFHYPLKELTPAMVDRFTRVDYPDNMALIAVIEREGVETQVGVARYARYPGTEAAEVAIVVADAWQGHGLGRRLLIEIRRQALAAGIHELHMTVLSDNYRMLRFAQGLGYRVHPARDDPTTRELGKPLVPDGD